MSDVLAHEGSGTSALATGEVRLNRFALARAFDLSESTVNRWIAGDCPVAHKRLDPGHENLDAKLQPVPTTNLIRCSQLRS